jgi:hypothetical protein
MADKTTQLSIVIRTVDQATAKIKAINDRLDKASKPTHDFKKALGELGEKSGLNGVIDGFKGVGSAIGDLLGKVAMIGGVVGLAGAGLLSLVNKFDDLGKKAQRIGIGADALASLEGAAKQSGAPVDALDSSLESFSMSLGRAQAGTGRMLKFINRVNPALAKQLVHTKNVQEATLDLADAFAKEEDPARRAALAAATGMDPALIPFLMKNGKGIKALTDEYAALAPGQGKAAAAAGTVKEAMNKVGFVLDGVEASIVTGLAPAITGLVEQLKEWLVGHQGDIKQWAASIGEKLPGAVHAVVDAVKGAVAWVSSFVDKVGGLKTVAVAVAAILAGPLIGALVTLGSAFVGLGTMVLASPIGLQIAAWTAAAVAFVGALAAAHKAGRWLADKVKYHKLVTAYAKDARAGDSSLSDAEVKQRAESDAAYQMGLDRQREELDDKTAQDRIEGTAKPSGPSFDEQLITAKAAALDFSGTSLAKNIATELAAVINGNSGGKSKITVDIRNAPKGTRAAIDPSSTGDVDMTMGHQLGFGS